MCGRGQAAHGQTRPCPGSHSCRNCTSHRPAQRSCANSRGVVFAAAKDSWPITRPSRCRATYITGDQPRAGPGRQLLATARCVRCCRPRSARQAPGQLSGDGTPATQRRGVQVDTGDAVYQANRATPARAAPSRRAAARRQVFDLRGDTLKRDDGIRILPSGRRCVPGHWPAHR